MCSHENDKNYKTPVVQEIPPSHPSCVLFSLNVLDQKI